MSKKKTKAVVFLGLLVTLLVLAVVAQLISKRAYAQQHRMIVCSDLTLRGSYGARFAGFVQVDASAPGMSGYGPIMGVARFVFDGNGNLSGTETVNFLGQGVGPATLTGNYTVSSDCTGTMSGTFQIPPPAPPTPFNGAFIIVDNAEELEFISTDLGSIVISVMKKQ